MVDFTYDAAGRMTRTRHYGSASPDPTKAVASVAGEFSWNLAGDLTQLDRRSVPLGANTLRGRTAYTHDDAGRLETIRHDARLDTTILSTQGATTWPTTRTIGSNVSFAMRP